MAGMPKVYAGGKGTVKYPSDRVKGLRNHRSQKSPKALISAELKRKKKEEKYRKKQW